MHFVVSTHKDKADDQQDDDDEDQETYLLFLHDKGLLFSMGQN